MYITPNRNLSGRIGVHSPVQCPDIEDIARTAYRADRPLEVVSPLPGAIIYLERKHLADFVACEYTVSPRVRPCQGPAARSLLAPPLLPGLFIECVEGAGARAYEYQVPGDRRCGPDSTACFKLPQNPGVRRPGEVMGSPGQQHQDQDGRSICSHCGSYYSQHSK